MVKKILKNFVLVIHFIILSFLFFGAFLSKKYLFYYLFAWPLLFLHWKTNGNKCIISQIECWLDNKPSLNHDEEFPFMAYILKFINIEINDNKVKNRIFCTSLTFFWLIGMYRYFY